MKKLFFILIIASYISASTLNLSISSSPSRLNPILSNDSASSRISSWIFNGLFDYDKDGKLVPELASSYKFETPTKLIIKLKKNVLWHDSKEFTSQDVLFTYEKIIDPKVFNSIKSNYKEVKEVKALDKYTLEINYKKPYFKSLLIWAIGMLPKHLLEHEKDLMTSKFNKHPIGTGPYKIDSFKIGQDIELYANKDYFKGKPKIDKLLFKFIANENTSFLYLKQKKLDLGGLTPLQFDRQIDNRFKKEFKIIEQPAFSYDYLGFNLKNPKFKNKKIREALSLAINRQELIDILYFGHGKVCNGPFLPNTYAFNKNIKVPKQNINQAKKILESLGYDKNNPFSFEVITNTGNNTRINAAQIIQYQLSKAGINMKIRVMEWQAFLNTIIHPRNFEAVILGWGLTLMPDAYPLWHSSSSKLGGFNLVNYKNKTVDELIEKGSNTVNQKELSQIYQKIFKLIAEDIPYLFLYIPNSITVVNNDIKNLEPSFIGVTHNLTQWIKE